MMLCTQEEAVSASEKIIAALEKAEQDKGEDFSNYLGMYLRTVACLTMLDNLETMEENQYDYCVKEIGDALRELSGALAYRMLAGDKPDGLTEDQHIDTQMQEIACWKEMIDNQISNRSFT